MARPSVLRLIVLVPLLAGCGILSRQRDAYGELQRAAQMQDAAARAEVLTRVRGAEPLLSAAWLASARSSGDPAAAAALLDRGREFLPADPTLMLSKLSLLGQVGQYEEEVAAARSALSQDQPAGLRSQLLWFLIDGLLGAGRIDEAAGQVVRLGGVPAAPASFVAAAWARVALARELAGTPDAADLAMEASLDLGPGGLSMLRHGGLEAPERRDAATRLIGRALDRQPDHPDLHLFRLVDRMASGDLEGASALVAALPEPLPERLVPEREALRARLLLLLGRTEEGLACLRTRLDDEPSDPYALGVLLESWHVRSVPSADEVAERLIAGRRRVLDPALAAEMDATLQDIAAAKGR